MSIQDVDKTRQRIIEAAGAVFAEKGFEAGTIREICLLAQANVAAVNYYFGDKQRLYLEAVKRAHQSKAQQAPLPHWKADTPPEEKLRGFVRTLLERMIGEDEASWHSQLMLREISRPNSACEELVSDYIRPHFEVLQSILAELLPDEVATTKRNLIAFSVIGQCLHYKVAQPVVRLLVTADEYSGYTPDNLAEHITDFTLAALGFRPRVKQVGGAA